MVWLVGLRSRLPYLCLPVGGVGLVVGPLLSPTALELFLSALDLEHLPAWVMSVRRVVGRALCKYSARPFSASSVSVPPNNNA